MPLLLLCLLDNVRADECLWAFLVRVVGAWRHAAGRGLAFDIGAAVCFDVSMVSGRLILSWVASGWVRKRRHRDQVALVHPRVGARLLWSTNYVRVRARVGLGLSTFADLAVGYTVVTCHDGGPLLPGFLLAELGLHAAGCVGSHVE